MRTTAYNPGAGPLQKSSLIAPGAFSHGSLPQGRGLGLSFIHQKIATDSVQRLRGGDPAECSSGFGGGGRSNWPWTIQKKLSCLPKGALRSSFQMVSFRLAIIPWGCRRWMSEWSGEWRSRKPPITRPEAGQRHPKVGHSGLSYRPSSAPPLRLSNCPQQTRCTLSGDHAWSLCCDPHYEGGQYDWEQSWEVKHHLSSPFLGLMCSISSTRVTKWGEVSPFSVLCQPFWSSQRERFHWALGCL